MVQNTLASSSVGGGGVGLSFWHGSCDDYFKIEREHISSYCFSLWVMWLGDGGVNGSLGWLIIWWMYGEADGENALYWWTSVSRKFEVKSLYRVLVGCKGASFSIGRRGSELFGESFLRLQSRWVIVSSLAEMSHLWANFCVLWSFFEYIFLFVWTSLLRPYVAVCTLFVPYFLNVQQISYVRLYKTMVFTFLFFHVYFHQELDIVEQDFDVHWYIHI